MDENLTIIKKQHAETKALYAALKLPLDEVNKLESFLGTFEILSAAIEKRQYEIAVDPTRELFYSLEKFFKEKLKELVLTAATPSFI